MLRFVNQGLRIVTGPYVKAQENRYERKPLFGPHCHNRDGGCEQGVSICVFGLI